MLFDPARHEILSGAPFHPDLARAAANDIVVDALEHFDPASFWPPHPLDERTADASLYVGAAGVIWALERLRDESLADAWGDRRPNVPSFAEHAARAIALDARLAGAQARATSWFLGEVGVRLAALRAGSNEPLDRVAELVEANVDHEAREVFWGAPGTLLAATFAFEATNERRFCDLARASGERLFDAFVPAGDGSFRLWTQHLYGDVLSYLGGAHGFAGNAHALLRARHLLDGVHDLERDLARTALATCVREGSHASWPAVHGEGRVARLVQWCHGAPGVVCALSSLRAPELDDVLVAAGELIFAAGPLAKGPGLCHGTAGNGHALLRLHERTGDERWLARARAFAMHAIEQVRAARERWGRGRYTLWTGDLGVALFLLDCIREKSALPMLDVF